MQHCKKWAFAGHLPFRSSRFNLKLLRLFLYEVTRRRHKILTQKGEKISELLRLQSMEQRGSCNC